MRILSGLFALATGSYASRPVGFIKGSHETCKIKMFAYLTDDVPYDGCIDMSDERLRAQLKRIDGLTSAEIAETAYAGKHMLFCYRNDLIMGVYYFEERTPLPMNPILYASRNGKNLGDVAVTFCKYISRVYDESLTFRVRGLGRM